jgi:hypothetical protein
MKTTEMFIEQILIGGTLLLIIYLLFPDIFQVIAKKWSEEGTLLNVFIGTTALGAAYLLGMVYDRFADTLLEDQEKRARLRYALEKYESDKTNLEDLFPESWYLILVLTAGEGVTERAAYLRSRIRLLRALTTLLPALAVSFSLWEIGNKNPNEFPGRAIVTLALVFVYGGVFLSKLFKVNHRPPKTYPEKGETPLDQIKKIKKHLEINWSWRDPVYIGLGLLIVLVGLLQVKIHKILFWLLPIVALAGTLLSGWCFLRVQETYFKLLDHYHGHWERQKTSTIGN